MVLSVSITPADRWATTASRSPGSRFGVLHRLPESCDSVAYRCGRTAYSCGGSPGIEPEFPLNPRPGNLSCAATLPQIARRVVQHFRQQPEPSPDCEPLTPRERDVVEQLAKGYRYKEIVDNLGISSGTLNSYIRNVYEKLHVHSRTEAVMKYLNR